MMRWDVEWFRVLPVVVAVAVAGTGCATNSASFWSRSNLDGVAAVDRVLVLPRMDGPAFTKNRRNGFEVGVRNRLAACGVEAKVVHEDALDLHPEERIAEQVRAFHASSVLILEHAGGTVGLNRPSEQLVQMKLLDVASGRLFWTARSHVVVDNGYDSDNPKFGVQFATGLVSKLRVDRVLTRCPPPGSEWPAVAVRALDDGEPLPDADCVEKRQSILAEAADIADKGERTRMIQSAPRCN